MITYPPAATSNSRLRTETRRWLRWRRENEPTCHEGVSVVDGNDADTTRTEVDGKTRRFAQGETAGEE